jgi:hypothetical protein
MNLMEINLQEKLSAALDAAAADQPSWLAGDEAFWTALRSGSTIAEALWAALDAAADDEPSWLAGDEAFEQNNENDGDENEAGWKRFVPFRDNQFSPRQLLRRDRG